MYVFLFKIQIIFLLIRFFSSIFFGIIILNSIHKKFTVVYFVFKWLNCLILFRFFQESSIKILQQYQYTSSIDWFQYTLYNVHFNWIQCAVYFDKYKWFLIFDPFFDLQQNTRDWFANKQKKKSYDHLCLHHKILNSLTFLRSLHNPSTSIFFLFSILFPSKIIWSVLEFLCLLM